MLPNDFRNLLAALVLASLESPEPNRELDRLVAGTVVQSLIFGSYAAAPALLGAVESALHAPSVNGPMVAIEELSKSGDRIWVHARGIGNALVGDCQAAKKDAARIRRLGGEEYAREFTLAKIHTLCEDQKKALKHVRRAYEAAASDDQRDMVRTWNENRLG